MPLIDEAEAGSACASRSKRLETTWAQEDEEEHFLNTFSFLANVSSYAAHLCTPASGKYFFIWVYLFICSFLSHRVDDIPAARCCLHFSLRRHAALEKEKTHIVIEKTQRLRIWDWMGSDRLRRSLINNKHPSFKLTSTHRRYAVGYSQDEWTFERNRRGYLLNLINMWDKLICVVAGLHLGDEGGRVSPLDSSERKTLCLLRLREWTSLPRVLNFTRTGSEINEGKWRTRDTLRRAVNIFFTFCILEEPGNSCDNHFPKSVVKSGMKSNLRLRNENRTTCEIRTVE